MSRVWMPLYIADFQMDTLDLKADEMGVYVALLFLAWRRDGPLPGDLNVLKSMLQRSLSDFHGHTFNRIVPKLLNRYFYRDTNGDFRQKRLEKELQIARKLSANASQNADKRWTKQKPNEENQPLSGCDGNARARVSQSQSHKDSFNGDSRQESRWIPTKRVGGRLFKIGEYAPAYDGQSPRNWKVLKPEDCQ